MSKPIARIVFSMLIALALVVGIYTSVLGASLQASAKSGRAQADTNLILSVGHHRTLVQEVESFDVQSDSYDELESDCDHDSTIDPEG
ncbi:MAG: hypothetical protein H7Y59_09085 [Anaerolineales bacterium]|nr:hypothetical protein [Anaerolineales bacterium]